MKQYLIHELTRTRRGRTIYISYSSWHDWRNCNWWIDLVGWKFGNGENVYFIKMLSLQIKKKRNDENTVILSFVDFGTRVEERSRILLFVRLVPFPPARGKYFILDKKESGYFTAVFDKVNTFLPFFAFDWWIVSLKKIRYPNLQSISLKQRTF